MLYAKVVLGLPVEGPFDYIVPEQLHNKIKPGVRVWIMFRTQKKLGYVVKLSRESSIKNLKKILEIIDDCPILDKNMLLLTKALSEHYCCSWGEAIETALPDGLRKGRKISLAGNPAVGINLGKKDSVLIHGLNVNSRRELYIGQIEGALKDNKSVIILLPDVNSALNTKEFILSKLNVNLSVLYRKKTEELEEWVRIKSGAVNIVIGTRSAIFAPVSNLGLVIIDEEQDAVYKQDQVPHYNAREMAIMRVNIEKAKLILGSSCPSLESFYLYKKNKIKYMLIPRIRDFPEIKIVDMKFEHGRRNSRDIILSKYLQDAVAANLNAGGKTLLFLNRKGFATFATCHNCGLLLRCPRCNINLVYHFKENVLRCHYCNFKIETPSICPDCNSGYIKFSGAGTEKIESELSRLFPTARIKGLDKQDIRGLKDIDIFIATSAIIKETNLNFELVGVIGIDNALNRIDLRASEKTFALLMGLLNLSEHKLVIQSRLAAHNCFQALLKKDFDLFYKEELKQRKQLGFPPYKHLVLMKVRSRIEEKAKKASLSLFEKLNMDAKSKGIEILSVNPGQPSKLRGNFYWQILIKASNLRKVTQFLKINLKDFPHSGIIVTVDVDPI